MDRVPQTGRQTRRPSQPSNRKLAVLVAIVLLAFALRLYRLGAESLWYDETVSVHLASQSIPALWAHTARDIHPPAYYLMLHAWTRLTGEPDPAARDFAVAFPSVVFGLLLVPLAYRLGRRVFGPKAALLAALLVAFSPYNLWYSQEVRMYTLGAALAMGLLCAVLSLGMDRTPRPPAWRSVALYAACGALGLWVLYYFAFLLLAVNLLVAGWWLLAWLRHRASRQALGVWLGRWALGQVAVALLYAPWVPIAWRQATSPPVPPWRGFTPLDRVIVETWSALSLGQSAEPARVWPVLSLVAGLFVAGLLARRWRHGTTGTRPSRRGRRIWPSAGSGHRRKPPTGQSAGGSGEDGRRIWPSAGGERTAGAAPWFLAGAVFIPVALIYTASLVTPLYHVRYAFTYSTPFYIIVGAGLAALGRWWRPLLWISLAVLLVFSGISIHAYHADTGLASDDHRAAVQYLSSRWRPGDAILVNAGYVYTALEAYWQGDPLAWRGRLVPASWPGSAERMAGGPVVLLTGTVDGDPGLGWGDPASDFYAMGWDETETALERLFDEFHRVWVYRCYDTVTDGDGAVRTWLADAGTQFEDRVFAGEAQLRVQGYLTGRDPLAASLGVSGESLVPQPVEASLADGSLRLVASALEPDAVPVGGELDVILVWDVRRSLDEPDPVLFAGLFDGDGRRWAQLDEHPLGTLLVPSGWEAGSTVRTPLRLTVPAGTPTGAYRLEVGWYRFVDGQPVWSLWATGERLVLAEVEVTAPANWWGLEGPPLDLEIGLQLGSGVRLLGMQTTTLEALPGATLELTLYWQALQDAPAAGLAVLQLAASDGTVVAEAQAAPAGGRAPFSRLAAGQVVRDPRSLPLPGNLAPGVYNLSVGRIGPDGVWLPVRRGPFPLGRLVPLATVRVPGRALVLSPPSVQVPLQARFGDVIQLVGVDLEPGRVTAYWQALSPMDVGYKVFLHVVGDGGPADIRAQSDLHPHMPTTAWQPGEYLSDEIRYDLPAACATTGCTLLLGLYDEATGTRLPVFDDSGQPLGDRVSLGAAGQAP